MPRCPAWCGHHIIREMGHRPGAEMGLVCPEGWSRLPAPAFIHSKFLRRQPWVPLISPFKWSSPVRDVLRVNNVKKIIPEEARGIYESTISNISALFTTIDSFSLLITNTQGKDTFFGQKENRGSWSFCFEKKKKIRPWLKILVTHQDLWLWNNLASASG